MSIMFASTTMSPTETLNLLANSSPLENWIAIASAQCPKRINIKYLSAKTSRDIWVVKYFAINIKKVHEDQF